jgi:hypothetical protein
MRAKRTLVPGQQGTKNLIRQYGSQPVCIRYRDDTERRLQCTTVAADHCEQAPRDHCPLPELLVRTLVGFARVEGKWKCNDRSNKLEAGGIPQLLIRA